jgi:hypothetical protein
MTTDQRRTFERVGALIFVPPPNCSAPITPRLPHLDGIVSLEPLAILGLVKENMRLGEGVRSSLGSAAQDRSPLIAHQ